MKTVARTTRRQGFTLLELLVTIGIIGLLIALTVPMVRKVKVAAQGAATSAQLTAIATAIQAYYGDFHAYPGPIANGELASTLWVPSVNPNVQLGTTSGTTITYTNPMPGRNRITGAENLVLGLLGGLEVIPAASGGGIAYNPTNIFPNASGQTTANTGAAGSVAPKGVYSLNPGLPKRFPSYLQVTSVQLSDPYSNASLAASNKNSYTDLAGRPANDSMIPEFIDQYAEPQPILYLRANVGGKAIAGITGSSAAGGTPLKDNLANNEVVVPQWDLAQVLGYTSTAIGIKKNMGYHGLSGLGNPTFITGSTNDTIANQYAANTGGNAIIYFKDPNVQPDTANGVSNTHGASARQKDAFILISAGPDGIYGTDDDVIYPGSLNP